MGSSPSGAGVKEWSKNAWEAMTGDGCTGIPDLHMEGPCQRHDRHYTFHTHKDGTPISRLESDWELAKDVWKAMPLVPPGPMTVSKAIDIPLRGALKVICPPIVFLGVRLFGWKFW